MRPQAKRPPAKRKLSSARLSPQQSRSTSARKKGGLPVAEIVTGIVLLWIISGSGLPKVMDFFKSEEIAEQADQIYFDLESAKLTALKNNHNMVMSFDPKKSQYTMHSDENNNGRVDPGERLKVHTLDPEILFHPNSLGVLDVWGNTPLTTQSIVFSDNKQQVTFAPSGQASADGAIYLARRSDLGKTAEYMRAIRILKSTGEIQVMKYRGGNSSVWE